LIAHVQVTQSKLVIVPKVPVKSLNPTVKSRDTRITLSPLLSCIESEQASRDTGGLLNVLQTNAIFVS